ncbi:hydroxyphenylacetyl-CoA thioesterase PaaI [Microvirga terricola]|uniref:Hydroxyphenylacetyl-CoA thioesterase PaaI n=1 Tax=Microvirga terricola TaxID=2719797 RepID=A0ABX0VA34_9HYPH|nr:hydroxyphenylacetyl-CoA thioesterase PaaI [Microvirga terricola]NIX75875.1 hydroxyphenylacetyl-CoA thioesterase PaaI [Microvirga terricola]
MTSMNPEQVARACMKAMWQADAASQQLDMLIEQVSPGGARISMTITSAMANGHATCHGGYIFTLADSAFAFACNTYNQRNVAQQAAITFIAPAFVGDRLTAIAREVSRRGRGGIYDVAVTNQAGDQIAEFRGHSRSVKGELVPETV